ncbi:ABC transporter permease [Nocardioides sp.]|uniref:ABC transporter permease n=1 Tax=Nocardioides sp. TaxID=35761 RepID=UPI0039E63DD5
MPAPTTALRAGASGRRRFALPSLTARGRAIVAIVLFLAVWQILAGVMYADLYTIADPIGILTTAVSDLGFARANIWTTATEAWWGWLLGNAVAIVVAMACVLASWTSAVLVRTSVVLYCLPVVAVGPILAVLFSQYWAVVVVSAQGVFFTTLIGALLGLRSAAASQLDVVHAAGGTTWQAMVRVRFRAAVPALFSALRIAGPLAVLGAMIGEYLGAKRGLGVAMVYAQQSLNVDRTWALAFYATVLAAAAYLITALAERYVYFWKGEERAADVSVADAASLTRPRRWWHAPVQLVATLGVVLGGWQALVASTDPYFGKRPADVWRFVTTADQDVLAPVWTALGETVAHTLSGFVAGLVLAVLGALLVVASPTAEATLMPIAMTLRTVPLVAMTPLIALVFGRGFWSVLVVSGVVTFFPALVTIVGGLRAVPAAAVEIVQVYGGGRWAALRLVRIPAALPSMFAAARVSAPLAVTGALLAEWLATGNGTGFMMLRAGATGNYNVMWTLVVLVTVLAVLLYGAASLCERIVQRART